MPPLAAALRGRVTVSTCRCTKAWAGVGQTCACPHLSSKIYCVTSISSSTVTFAAPPTPPPSPPARQVAAGAGTGGCGFYAGGRGARTGGRGPGTVWSTYPPLPGEGGWFYEICMCVFYGSGSSSHSLAPLSPLVLSPAPWRPGGQGEKIKTEREGGGAGGAGGGTGGPWRDPSPHSVPTPRSRDTHLLLLHLHHLVQAEVVGSYPRVVHLVKAHDDRVPDTRLVRRHDLADLVEPV